MVFYINKQAVEIKTRFENAPLTSPNEACAAIGMLCGIFGLPLLHRRETVGEMKAGLHAQLEGLPVPTDFAGRIIGLLDGYRKDAPVTDEIYELLTYCYEEQK